nr:hypothetical protein HmN_000066500 [Hymenolepis microstoma]
MLGGSSQTSSFAERERILEADNGSSEIYLDAYHLTFQWNSKTLKIQRIHLPNLYPSPSRRCRKRFTRNEPLSSIGFE